MMLYSKVVTIRDNQLAENKRLENEWLLEQKKLDLMMEIDRLRDLKQQEEKELARVQATRKGAEVIIEQIKERDQERVKEHELREREKMAILATIERQKQEELKLA